jgi:hypothetical protein
MSGGLDKPLTICIVCHEWETSSSKSLCAKCEFRQDIYVKCVDCGQFKRNFKSVRCRKCVKEESRRRAMLRRINDHQTVIKSKRPLLPKFTPTDHLPGTPEKIKVMMWRDSMNLPLFHPKDATLEKHNEKR